LPYTPFVYHNKHFCLLFYVLIIHSTNFITLKAITNRKDQGPYTETNSHAAREEISVVYEVKCGTFASTPYPEQKCSLNPLCILEFHLRHICGRAEKVLPSLS